MHGQIAHDTGGVRRRRRSQLCLLALLASLAACGRHDGRNATTTVSVAHEAEVVSSSGATRAARVGDRLQPGDTVRTRPSGFAGLDTRGRQVLLAGGTSVRAVDGENADLLAGSVLVDRRRGPGLALHAGEVTVSRIARGALRVDRDRAVRVAVYAGRARAQTDTGRQVEVGGLHQVAAAGRTLPDAAAPLALRGDDWERRVIPEVVAADVALDGLARAVDSDLRTPALARTAVPAVYAAAAPAPDAPASEVLLPIAIDRAAGSQRSAPDRATTARALREAGGSWGVVATLVAARATDVALQLSALFPGTETVIAADTGAATVAGGAAGAAGALAPTAAPGGSSSTGGTDAGGDGDSGEGAGGTDPEPSPSRSPRPSPTSSPTPSPSPSDPVRTVVDTVVRLLPTPLPTPPVPTPTPPPPGS